MRAGRKRSSVFTGALLVLAIAALLFGGIGSARAALTPSDEYIADIGTQDIALVLNENGKEVGEEDALLADLLGDDESVKVGKVYDEKLTVSNTGTIDQYVRVSVYRYWTKDGEEAKHTELTPDLINVEFNLGDGWVKDDAASTPERTVLYYTKKLEAGKNNETTPFITGIGVDKKLSNMVSQTPPDENGVIKTTFKYNGYEFNLEASVDGVQDHHAEEAAKSAWGVGVTVDEEAGTLSLGE